MSRRFLTALLTVLGAVLLSANAQDGQTMSDEQHLHVALNGLPRSLSPIRDTATFAYTVYNLLYEPLVRASNVGELEGALAVSWEPIDNVTWQFKLREGVVFHNGEPFDAEAAKYTIEMNLDPNTTSAFYGRVNSIVDVQVVDEYTLNLITETPNAYLPANLTVVYMVAPAYWETAGEEAFAEAPAGTGPFKFEDWERDNFLRLVANDEYHSGRPKLDAVTLYHVPETSTRVARLEAGEVHVAYALPAEQVNRLEGRFIIDSVMLGQNTTVNLMRVPAQAEELRDKRVRQAINYAVDKEVLVDVLLMGYGRPLGQMVGPDAFGFNPEVQPYPYDPERARELLAEAGYPDGFTVKFYGTDGRYPRDREITLAIAGQLADVGITAEVEILESGTWTEMYQAATLGHMWMSGWQWLPPMDAAFAYQHFHSDSVRVIWSNPEFDRLFDAQATTLDRDERLSLLHELAELFHDEAPQLMLMQPAGVFGLNTRVNEIVFRPDWGMDLSHTWLSQP